MNKNKYIVHEGVGVFHDTPCVVVSLVVEHHGRNDRKKRRERRESPCEGKTHKVGK
jgi:hypothetical protein